MSAINKVTKQFDHIDDHNRELDQEIKQLISDEQILFVSLRNRYPELLVYNMRTDNAFMYGKPQREYYSTWQTINQGAKPKSVNDLTPIINWTLFVKKEKTEQGAVLLTK